MTPWLCSIEVRENTDELTKQSAYTFAESTNLAVNQTLIRSINTSVTSILPVGSILFIGVLLVGAGTLRDLALVMFIGLNPGPAISSIFIASPIAVALAERSSAIEHTAQVLAARDQRPEDEDIDLLSDGVPSHGVIRHPGVRKATRPTETQEEEQEVSEKQPVPEETVSLVQARLREVQDFPAPGVLFRDITPLIADSEGFGALIDMLADRYRGKVDAVAGLESRGFILAAPLAIALGVGMVTIRKAGRLPGPVVGVDYDLEYGSARMEVQPFTVEDGQRVLILDDVLATGGTANAAFNLVEQAGGVPVGAVCAYRNWLIWADAPPFLTAARSKPFFPY